MNNNPLLPYGFKPRPNQERFNSKFEEAMAKENSSVFDSNKLCWENNIIVKTFSSLASGKTNEILYAIRRNILQHYSEKTFSILVAPKIRLCKQHYADTINTKDAKALRLKKHQPVGFFDDLKNTKVYIRYCNTNDTFLKKPIDKNSEFFSDVDAQHIIIIYCSESLWGVEDGRSAFNSLKALLNNNIKFNRLNLTIAYDEAHLYTRHLAKEMFGSLNDTIKTKTLEDYFNVSILATGTPTSLLKESHFKNEVIERFSPKDAAKAGLICKPTLNLCQMWAETCTPQIVSMIISHELSLPDSKLFPLHVLVNLNGKNDLHSANDEVTNILGQGNFHYIINHSKAKGDLVFSEIDGYIADPKENTLKAYLDDTKKSLMEQGKLYEDEPFNDIIDFLAAVDRGDIWDDGKPVIVYQIDTISEGINVNSFNAVLLTSQSQVTAFQQAGRSFRDYWYKGHRKLTEGHASIYLVYETSYELSNMLINLESHEIDEDVFQWGCELKYTGGKRREDENAPIDGDGSTWISLDGDQNRISFIKQLFGDRKIREIKNDFLNVLTTKIPEFLSEIVLKGKKSKISRVKDATKLAIGKKASDNTPINKNPSDSRDETEIKTSEEKKSQKDVLKEIQSMLQKIRVNTLEFIYSDPFYKEAWDNGDKKFIAECIADKYSCDYHDDITDILYKLYTNDEVDGLYIY